MFSTGDTITVIYGNEKPEQGFYISHGINRDDLFNPNSEEARVLGYSDIIMISKDGKKKQIIYGDYPENTIGYLRAFNTRMVLIEKNFLINTIKEPNPDEFEF